MATIRLIVGTQVVKYCSDTSAKYVPARTRLYVRDTGELGESVVDGTTVLVRTGSFYNKWSEQKAIRYPVRLRYPKHQQNLLRTSTGRSIVFDMRAGCTNNGQ